MEHMDQPYSILSHEPAILAESPAWDEVSETCYWLDIEGKKIFGLQWKTKALQQYDFENRPSLIIPGKSGNLLIALQGGIASFNKESRELTLLTDLGTDWTNTRCND